MPQTMIHFVTHQTERCDLRKVVWFDYLTVKIAYN